MNSRTQWIAAVVVTALIACAVGFVIGRRADTPAPSSNSTQGHKVLYWHDPMVPGSKFDKPGKSPFMDMQLVPVYADEPSASAVRVSPNVRQSLGIRTAKVERRILAPRLDAVGSVSFDETLLHVVQARVDGTVTRLYVKAPFERVRRGQPLAEVLSSDWLTAQQDYLTLLASNTETSKPIREAARQRLLVLGVPEQTIQTLERDHQTNPTTTVFSPIDGVMSELSVREGGVFPIGAALFRINGLSRVWVNAQIPEAAVALASANARAEVRANAWPGMTFHGHVAALLPDVNAQTRTATARVVIDNPRGELLPGMFVSMSIVGDKGQSQLVVPGEAVIETGERKVVVVANGDGTFDVASVQTGTEQDGFSTVISGLTEGQTTVLSGQFLIDSEASLKSTVDRMGHPPVPGQSNPATTPERP
jgi:membrane fusion protein, copper/silver efflux system